MEFKFSIMDAVREAWVLFKKHFGFFVGIAAVNVVIGFLPSSKNTPIAFVILAAVASFVWSIVWMKISLAAADNKEDQLSFKSIKNMLPSWHQLFGLIGLGILVGLIILGGMILVIIPGLYFAFRLSLANLVFIDQGLSVKKSIKESWKMTKGKVFWTVVLVGLCSGLLYIVGIIFFGVGILITYPIAIILMAKFYRALTSHYSKTQAAVVVQPAEIVAPTV